MKQIRFVFILAVAVAALTVSSNARAEKVYGTWYFMLPGTDPAVVAADMKKIAAMGFNHVMFPAFVSQKDAASIEVVPPDQNFLDLLGKAADSAKAAGLKTSFTGFLLVGDGAWRGTILPASKKKWAVSYLKAIEPHLKLAAEKKVDMFCVSSEMESMKIYPEVWNYIIEKARRLYGGELGYNTNWWSGSSEFNTVLNMMNWLSKLDFIGVSGYFPLTKKTDPTREELVAAWSNDARGVNVLKDFADLKKKYPDKRIFSWEVGYRSMDGANREPWNWGVKAESDPAEQADCFAAFMNAFKDSALDGFVIWSLDPGLTPRELGYDFYGKPAQQEVEKFIKENTSK